MEKNLPDFSQPNLRELLQSPAGQQLVAMLQQQHRAELQQAMALILAGRKDDAYRLLSPILESPEAQSLLQQLGGSHG